MVQNGWCECEDGCLRTARQMLVNLLCGFCSTRSISFYPNCGDGTRFPGMQHCVAKPTKTKNPPNRRHCCESNLKNALPHSSFSFFFVSSNNEEWISSPSPGSVPGSAPPLSPSPGSQSHTYTTTMSNGYSSPMSTGSYDPYSPNGKMGK